MRSWVLWGSDNLAPDETLRLAPVVMPAMSSRQRRQNPPDTAGRILPTPQAESARPLQRPFPKGCRPVLLALVSEHEARYPVLVVPVGSSGRFNGLTWMREALATSGKDVARANHLMNAEVGITRRRMGIPRISSTTTHAMAQCLGKYPEASLALAADRKSVYQLIGRLGRLAISP
jgi:hypothetical protein